MRTPKRITGVLLAAVLFIAACSTKKEEAAAIDMDKLKTDIQAMEDAYAAGEKAKDVDAVAAYYSEDATSYNRNAPPSVGIAAIKEKIAKNLANDSAGVYSVYKVVDLFAEGNTATEIGSWTRMSADGNEMESGYYMSYFQKRDGKYLCVRDMSVTSSPAKAANE
ncbi:MAG TPA: nuclear transport factor 2 family protein [Chitinophagaceae bacterium]|nr:nuclear transport factor 2 family protein [Chitinophagaceae bacterium]HRX93186.1 nuclear transport factor 2 family protein [Chitinophagaceae bacterium]